MPIDNFKIGYAALKSTGNPAVNPLFYNLNVVLSVASGGTDRYITFANSLRVSLIPIATSYYGLAVYKDLASAAYTDPFTSTSAVTKIRTKAYQIYSSGTSNCIRANNTGGSSTPVASLVLHSAQLAVNSSGDLIVVPVTGTITATDDIYIGDKALRVVQIGTRYCLVMSY